MDTEVQARICGVLYQMSEFEFYFAVWVETLVLNVTDDLSKTLQHSHVTASDDQEIAERVVKCLETMRRDRHGELLWEYVNQTSKGKTQTIKVWRRIGTTRIPGNSRSTLSQSLERVSDWEISAIKRRFDQPGYKTAVTLEDLLSKAANGKPFEDSMALVKIHTHYDGDFDLIVLRGQFTLLRSAFYRLFFCALKTDCLFKNLDPKILSPQIPQYVFAFSQTNLNAWKWYGNLLKVSKSCEPKFSCWVLLFSSTDIPTDLLRRFLR